jgi:nicotinate-nucleotide adenylyltransferase
MGRGPDTPGVVPLRLGLFGGTFDPPHNGHVTVAKDVADALELHRLLWIPAGEPPHKSCQEVTPASLRLQMVYAAVAADARFEVSEYETMRAGRSYTVDTLNALRREFPEAAMYFIVGGDEYEALAGWREPEQVLEIARLAVVDRDGTHAAQAIPDVVGAEAVDFVPVEQIDISSSQVRVHVAAGRDAADLVPPAVAAIIERERLYRD